MKHILLRWLRYLLVLPSAIASWWLTLVIGTYCLSVLTRYGCPEGFGSGHDCYAPSWRYVEQGVMAAFAGLSAFAVIFAVSTTAPLHKRAFRIGAFLAGVFCAVLFAFALGLWLPCLAAIAIGAITLLRWPRNTKLITPSKKATS